MRVQTMRIEGIPTPVSTVGIGTRAFGGPTWGRTDEPGAIQTLRAAVERGINLIDTSPTKGLGYAEELVGRALAGLRNKAVIATKMADLTGYAQLGHPTGARDIQREVEDSLRRLRTDRIDLYHVSEPNASRPVEETAIALERLLRDGKILAVGLCHFSTTRTDAMRAVLPVATLRSPYNLYERNIEADVLPYARKNTLTVLAHGSLCRGLLSGRMTPDTTFGQEDRRRTDPKFQRPRFDRYVGATKELAAMACYMFGKPVQALAIRWILDQGPTIAIWGARRPEQLLDIDKVFGWKLSAAHLGEIEDLINKNTHTAHKRVCARQAVLPASPDVSRFPQAA